MATTQKLSDYSVLVFDVYGTLADWETGLHEALQPLLNRYPASKAWTRKDALTAFGSVETDLQAQYPNMIYSDLLAKVHQVLEERLKALSGGSSGGASVEAAPAPASEPSTAGASTSGAASSSDDGDAHRAFGDSIRNWPIFKDTSAALHRLAKHFKLVVLSNVDRESFRHTHLALSEGPQPPSNDGRDSTFAKSKLDLYSYHASSAGDSFWRPQETEGSNSPFTLIVTAQDVGCYKPALGGFQAILRYIADHPDVFGVIGQADVDGVKGRTLCVAQSLIHDHVPAAKLGLKSVWIDRQSAVTCNEDVGGVKNWTWRFETLGEFADAVEKEVADRNASRKD